jgi:pyruvate dehydrogenase E2 component (dihydrolipoamide acetyltransferase)
MPDITMPQLGESVTEGTITRWMKSVGERVELDEVLFEVSTDKVDSEVPSPVAGVLTEILVDEGETVEVGVRLAVVGDAVTAEAPETAGAASEPAESPDADGGSRPDGADGADGSDQNGAALSAAVRPQIEEPVSAPGPEEIAPAAPSPPPSASEPAATADTGTVAVPSASGGAPPGAGVGPPALDGPVLSPVVRRLLAEHGLQPADIKGTGVGGRITRSDVLQAVERRAQGSETAVAPSSSATPPPGPSGPVPAPSPARQAPPASAPRVAAPPASAPSAAVAVVPGEDDEIIPFTNIRRRTAEHMVRSKAVSAHTFTVIEADYHRVDQARTQFAGSFRESEGFGLSYLPFIIRAAVDAIQDYPRINASVGEDSLIVHHRVHLGVAVDLDLEGLIVPVVKDVESKRLRAVAREIRDLAGRARSRQLGADEISGGTFTVTNPGPFGTLMTVPIINQPQVAILSTDGVKRRPVVAELADGGEGIVIHPVGLFGLSYDHRAIDGAYASAFLARCREIIETRDWTQEL